MGGSQLFDLSFVLVDIARSTGVDRFQTFKKALLGRFMYDHSRDSIGCWILVVLEFLLFHC